MNSKNHFLSASLSGWQFSWKGFLTNKHGEWWLAGQLLIITAHFSPSWPTYESSDFTLLNLFNIIGVLLILIGIYISIKAFIDLGASLSPLPDPKPKAELKTNGIYSYCRHPLYQGLLISSMGFVLYLESILHLILFVSLSLVLKGKAMREEKQLKIIHPRYIDYIKSTPAIISSIPILDWRN